MYLGLVSMVIPISITVDSWWPVLTGIVLFFYLHLVVIPAEEHLLQTYFSEPYADYCSRVPRWFGPI